MNCSEELKAYLKKIERSLVKTKLHCIKLLWDKLTARHFPSQVNEIYARVAVLNNFTDLRRPHTRVGS